MWDRRIESSSSSTRWRHVPGLVRGHVIQSVHLQSSQPVLRHGSCGLFETEQSWRKLPSELSILPCPCIYLVPLFRYHGWWWDALQDSWLESLPGGEAHTGAGAGSEDVEQPGSEGRLELQLDIGTMLPCRIPGFVTRFGGLTDECLTWQTDPC